MEVAFDIGEGKAAEIKVEVGKGADSCGNTFWGSTSVPVEAKVRVVGTGAYIVEMGTTKETTWARDEGKKGRTWVVEGTDHWRFEDACGIWEGELPLDALGCCLFFGGESSDCFSDCLLPAYEWGLWDELSKGRRICGSRSCPSIFITSTPCRGVISGDESPREELSSVSSLNLFNLHHFYSKCSSKGVFPMLALGWLTSCR